MDCKENGLSRDADRALNLAINDSIPAHDEVEINETEIEAQSESMKGKDMDSETSDDDDYDYGDDDEYGSEQGVYRVMCRKGLIVTL